MAKTTSAETIIARGVRVEGDFVCDGDIVIEGEVKGSIKADGDLRVGEDAKIVASVTARNAFVSGSIEGLVNIGDRLEMSGSAVIVGDVATSVFSVAAGAKLNGTIKMGDGIMNIEDDTDTEEDDGDIDA
ncbi:polymer-forming cytoskeletal protein [Patescibacteria group bacterium]|nr:polymer-forming cytoskeletal protein [Patescibacteria group bacterium]